MAASIQPTGAAGVGSYEPPSASKKEVEKPEPASQQTKQQKLEAAVKFLQTTSRRHLDYLQHGARVEAEVERLSQEIAEEAAAPSEPLRARL